MLRVKFRLGVFSPGVFSLFRMALFRYFVFSRGVFSSFRLAFWFGEKKRNNVRRKKGNNDKMPREITKRRNNARGKDEITKRRQAQKTKNKSYFAWNFSSLRSRFRHFAWCILLFRLFAWHKFVFSLVRLAFFSLFRLFAWRYFILVPRHNARRKDEKTK